MLAHQLISRRFELNPNFEWIQQAHTHTSTGVVWPPTVHLM